MFKTMIDPKMKGAVTCVRKAIGSAPGALIANRHRQRRSRQRDRRPHEAKHRLLHDPGKRVSGHRSKQSTRNMTASAVT